MQLSISGFCGHGSLVCQLHLSLRAPLGEPASRAGVYRAQKELACSLWRSPAAASCSSISEDTCRQADETSSFCAAESSKLQSEQARTWLSRCCTLCSPESVGAAECSLECLLLGKRATGVCGILARSLTVSRAGQNRFRWQIFLTSVVSLAVLSMGASKQQQGGLSRLLWSLCTLERQEMAGRCLVLASCLMRCPQALRPLHAGVPSLAGLQGGVRAVLPASSMPRSQASARSASLSLMRPEKREIATSCWQAPRRTKQLEGSCRFKLPQETHRVSASPCEPYKSTPLKSVSRMPAWRRACSSQSVRVHAGSTGKQSTRTRTWPQDPSLCARWC